MRTRLSILFFLVTAYASCFAQAQPLPQPPAPLLMPPIPPSPIDEFRRWLRMPQPEREDHLAGYPEEKRLVLGQKLEAYAAMPAEQRERRLTMLELRWYLRPLMGVAPAQRGNFLSMIPPRLHEIVTSRLARWDQLDANTRAEILANDDAREMVTRYFAYVRRSPASAQAFSPLDSTQQAELREKLKYWQSTTPAQRERMGRQLEAFFEMPKSAQEKTLGHLSETERQEMQRTLRAFANLTPEHRRACVESFQKFASMAPGERAEFLRKAERWQEMSAQERETWKRLVNKLPPMPPLPVPIPPLPGASLPQAPSLATSNSTRVVM